MRFKILHKTRQAESMYLARPVSHFLMPPLGLQYFGPRELLITLSFKVSIYEGEAVW